MTDYLQQLSDAGITGAAAAIALNERVKELEHAIDTAHDVYNRLLADYMVQKERITELEKENAKINFLFEQESAAREQLDKVNTGLVDTIHDLDEKIAELENEKWESDL